MTSFSVGRLMRLQPPHGPWQRGAWIQWHGVHDDWRPPSVAAFIRLQYRCDLQCHLPPLPPLRSLDRTLSGTSPSTLPPWLNLPGAASSRRHRSQVHWNTQGSPPRQGGDPRRTMKCMASCRVISPQRASQAQLDMRVTSLTNGGHLRGLCMVGVSCSLSQA